MKEEISRQMPRNFFSSTQFQRKRKSLVFFQSINFLCEVPSTAPIDQVVQRWTWPELFPSVYVSLYGHGQRRKDKGDFRDFFLFMNVIQHCFICRPTDLSDDAGIEPRTVPTLALTARRSNQSARSDPRLG